MSHVIPRIIPDTASIIAYEPLEGEVDYAPIIRPLSGRDLLLPTTATKSPEECASLCIRYFLDTPVSLLIPGTRFDLSGTRIGRGGGWYDRFLAQVPSEWIRIGVMHVGKISAFPLKREAHDQPVDWLLAYDGESWQAFETHARS